MPLTVLATFFDTSHTAVAMCTAGVAVLLVGAFSAKNDIAAARGLDKIVVLSNLCFAAPLAVFGALHLFAPQFVKDLVPPYMPWRMFWVYFVGCALLAASLSIATRIAVRWSGLLVGIMMFLFVALLYVPGGLRQLHAGIPWARSRITWTIVFRESSFGGAGWIFAGSAKKSWPQPIKSMLINVGRVLIAMAAVFFGIQHFLHPLGLPGVPLQRQMPSWVPGRMLIDYLTGAGLLLAGGSILLSRKTRTVTTWLGCWILLTIVLIYGPVMIAALFSQDIGVQVEGINYFADTLLFAGAILAVASATSKAAGATIPPEASEAAAARARELL